MPDKDDTEILQLNNLAANLWKQGRLAEAEALEERVVSLCKVFYGEDHPKTLRAMASLSRTLYDQKKFDAALATEQHIFETRFENDGIEHRETSVAAWSLLRTLIDLKRPEAASEVFNKALVWMLDRDPADLEPEQREIRANLINIFQQSK